MIAIHPKTYLRGKLWHALTPSSTAAITHCRAPSCIELYNGALASKLWTPPVGAGRLKRLMVPLRCTSVHQARRSQRGTLKHMQLGTNTSLNYVIKKYVRWSPTPAVVMWTSRAMDMPVVSGNKVDHLFKMLLMTQLKVYILYVIIAIIRFGYGYKGQHFVLETPFWNSNWFSQ